MLKWITAGFERKDMTGEVERNLPQEGPNQLEATRAFIANPLEALPQGLTTVLRNDP